MRETNNLKRTWGHCASLSADDSDTRETEKSWGTIGSNCIISGSRSRDAINNKSRNVESKTGEASREVMNVPDRQTEGSAALTKLNIPLTSVVFF